MCQLPFHFCGLFTRQYMKNVSVVYRSKLDVCMCKPSSWLKFAECCMCTWPYMPSNSHHTIGSPERNKHHPQIVAAASICGTCTRVWILSDDNHQVSAQAFRVVWLVSTADSTLRGCAYYWYRLTVVAVSLVRTLSSHRWCLWAFQRNKHLPQIVATEKPAVKKKSGCGVWLKKYGTMLTILVLPYTVV